MNKEIEVKFVIPDSATFRRLQSLTDIAGYSLSPPSIHRIRDTYLDTVERSILSAGFACRRREDNGRILMTLKALTPPRGVIHEREELEVLLSEDGPPESWPDGAARERAVAMTRGAPLEILFHLRQTRRVRVMIKDGRKAAALSLDKARMTASGRGRSFLELEVEQLPEGAEADLAAIAASLREEHKLDPAARSKFERGLDLLVAVSPPVPAEYSLDPSDTADRAGVKILRAQAFKLRANTAGAMRDLDSEFVHDMRVASRRARFALKLFPCAHKSRCDELRGELSWIAALLGTVRDLDVFLGHLKSQLAIVEADKSFPEAIHGELSRRREEALSALRQALGSPRYARLLEALDTREAAPDDHGPSREPVTGFAERRIEKASKRLRAWREKGAAGFSPAEMHALRILFKRLRYTSEFFLPLFGKPLADMIETFKAFQDCLGAYLDACFAQDVLLELSEKRPDLFSSRQLMLSLGALIQVQRSSAGAERDRFLLLWSSAADFTAPWKRRRPKTPL